ncbi:MAG: hypothetical protein AABY64_09555 [Bdellovibrionota bacterium]
MRHCHAKKTKITIKPGKTKVYPEATKIAINIRLDAVVINE